MPLYGTIFIDNMRLRAYHGVLEQERVVGNDYRVTISVDYPMNKAFASDCVDDTLSYADLAEIVRREMGVPSALVEHVAGRIVNAVTGRYPAVARVRVKICKVSPPMPVECDGAGVEIEWRPTI